MAAAAQADVYVVVLLRADRRGGGRQPPPGPCRLGRLMAPGTPQRTAAWPAGVWPTFSSRASASATCSRCNLEPPERLEGWNRRLAALLEADSGWSQTKLLRLPGTYNHKPRAAGGRSILVRWL